MGWIAEAGILCIFLATQELAWSTPEPCEPTTSWCDGWNCRAGSVANAGTLSKTEDIICVGDSSGSSVSGTTFNNGRKDRTCHNDCGDSWTDGPYDISYSPNSWWEPPIPGSFPDCGTFSYTAYVKGTSSDSDCPGDTGTATVGTFTVKVVAVTDLSPDLSGDQGGLESGSDPPTYWVCPCASGDVIVTAIPCPNLAAGDLPSCWSFTGGVAIDKLHHKVSKASLQSGPVTFTVTAGTSTKTIILKTDEEKEIYDTYIPAQACLYDNFTDPSPYTDKCGNTLAINCVGGSGWPLYRAGHYEYRYNGTWVGTCYFNGGENNFLYKTTKHNCRILRTWHLTQEPVSPTHWVVSKYDCLTGGPLSQNCRTAPSWNPNWDRPADETLNSGYPANSCENQGTPSTPCPPW